MTQVSAMVKYVPILPTTVNSHDIGGSASRTRHAPQSRVVCVIVLMSNHITPQLALFMYSC